MKNVTLAVEEDLLEASRKYAKEHHTTLNGLVRDLLGRTVKPGKQPNWQTGLFALADAAKGRSRKRWQRDELYDV
jgi:hypothetical protein